MTQHTNKPGYTPKPQQPSSPPDRKDAMHPDKREGEKKGYEGHKGKPDHR